MTKHWTDDIYGCWAPGECNCGSDKERERFDDSKGICVTYACDDCRRDKLGGYRRDIFEGAYPDMDEPIEPEEY